MRCLLLLLTTLTFAGCSVSDQAATTEATISSAPALSEVEGSFASSASPLEQVPSDLSLEHFSKMRLAGTGLTLSAVLDDNAAYTRHAVEYWSNGLRISGILNIPKGQGPFPLLMLNHGYIATSVYTRGRGLKREQDYLARQGFAVFHSDYRGHAESDESPDTRDVYDAAIEYSMDVINAVNAVRAAKLPTVDASRVGMLGHSMGGGVTLNILTMHPDMIDAAVLYAPVNADAWENFNRWWTMRDESDRTREVLGTRADHPENWDKLSSQTYLGNIDDPVLLFQGSNDKDVPEAWSDDLHAELTGLAKDVTYVEYAGEGHEYSFQWNDFMRRTAEFLTRHLKVVSR